MTRRAVLLDSGLAPAAIAREATRLCADWDEVIVAIDDVPARQAPLAERWSALRTRLRGLANCWVTPLVRTPDLDPLNDRCAALPSRLGRFELLVASAEVLEAARPLGFRVQLLEAYPAEPQQAADEAARALVVLRAQPFHRGHLALVEQALAQRDELVLVVAAAERALTARDPFTAGERLALVRAGLGPLLERVWLVALPAPRWPAMALRQLAYLTPGFDLVLAHNPLLRALAEQQGLPVGGLAQPFQVGGVELSASQLRARLATERAGPWLETYVPSATCALLSADPWLAGRCALIAEAER